ncbi:MAG: hypothetical protein V4543_05480 [Bacteroidota bacterium]
MKNIDLVALRNPDDPLQLYSIHYVDKPVSEWQYWTELFQDAERIEKILEERESELLLNSLDKSVVKSVILSEGKQYDTILKAMPLHGTFKSLMSYKNFYSGKLKLQNLMDYVITIYGGRKRKRNIPDAHGVFHLYEGSHTRLYGLMFGSDTLVIIGGCIKTSENLQGSVFTKHIPGEIDRIQSLFNKFGATRDWFDGDNFPLYTDNI